ncbi:MAG: acyl-CoA thioesterase [Lachnospiraceae bacterium]|nr:acyl-CoA thioesterase [Lachnospiraceae bacterium]MCI9101476.1 acyl-CoA thioesterase [Lachnospiraceae bacterium]MCI9359038.1 acyl-CoA thioesterase [Lachnospiraceae bacterium]
MKPYEHFTQYYETDQMGIIHHSNYIRWLEEARVFYMDEIGFGYGQMEEKGIYSPVFEVSCQYKHMVRFHECVQITVSVEKYNGVRLYLKYEIVNKDTQVLCATAKSTHCFLDRAHNIVMLKKSYPELDRKLKELIS